MQPPNPPPPPPEILKEYHNNHPLNFVVYVTWTRIYACLFISSGFYLGSRGSDLSTAMTSSSGCLLKCGHMMAS